MPVEDPVDVKDGTGADLQETAPVPLRRVQDVEGYVFGWQLAVIEVAISEAFLDHRQMMIAGVDKRRCFVWDNADSRLYVIVYTHFT